MEHQASDDVCPICFHGCGPDAVQPCSTCRGSIGSYHDACVLKLMQFQRRRLKTPVCITCSSEYSTPVALQMWESAEADASFAGPHNDAVLADEAPPAPQPNVPRLILQAPAGGAAPNPRFTMLPLQPATLEQLWARTGARASVFHQLRIGVPADEAPPAPQPNVPRLILQAPAGGAAPNPPSTALPLQPAALEQSWASTDSDAASVFHQLHIELPADEPRPALLPNVGDPLPIAIPIPQGPAGSAAPNPALAMPPFPPGPSGPPSTPIPLLLAPPPADAALSHWDLLGPHQATSPAPGEAAAANPHPRQWARVWRPRESPGCSFCSQGSAVCQYCARLGRW